MTYLDQLAIALENFSEKVDSMDMGPLEHFTCTEANALAHLMAIYHLDESKAHSVILNHIGEGEEEDELRCHIEDYPALIRPLRDYYAGDTGTLSLIDAVEEDIARGARK